MTADTHTHLNTHTQSEMQIIVEILLRLSA